MERRSFLKHSLSSLAALTVLPGVRTATAESLLTKISESPSKLTTTVGISLRATRRQVSILPGSTTPVWSFRGSILKGGPGRLEPVPGSYLGPTLRFHQGDRVSIAFRNRLPEKSVVHWHGLHVPEAADGHPRFAIPPGRTYTSTFDVLNRAGTYWYHPHPHGRTGPQVYRGLAGLIIVSDDEEQALDLPRGDYDVPLVLQDRTFGGGNRLLYDHVPMAGFLGETILVNGRPDYVLDVDSRPYRLRLLNGSNARIYKLEFGDGTPVRVIGTDGGLLRRPVRRPYLTLAPGERLELWVDFGNRRQGDEIVLRSLEFDGSGFRPGGGPGMMSGVLPQGAAFDVMRFRIAREVTDPHLLPNRLSRIRRLRRWQAVNGANPKSFRYAMRRGRWSINNRTFQMEAVADEETVALGSIEAWDISNNTSGGGGGPGGMGMGMGMGMPHPVHLHGSHFQIIDRSVSSRFRSAWDSVAGGYVDGGWKDTVLLMPGETVRILKRFDDYPGLFLQHCHNLEHEDAGMMRNILVV